MPAAGAWWTAIGRSRFIPILFASALLALPLTTAPLRIPIGLTWTEIELLALIGVGVGWFLTDRALAMGATPVLAALALVLAVAVVFVPLNILGPENATVIGIVLPVAFGAGALIRGTRPDNAGTHTLVPAAALALWIVYDLGRLPVAPLRDLHLYLGAARAALEGRSVYLEAPLTEVPPASELPFVYAPVTLPLFELLALLPLWLAEAIWVGLAVAAALAALWLLGVRGRWLVCLLAWPPLSLGIAVGNVAVFTFLLFVLAYRVGAALVLSGVFKPQSALSVVWLIRDRRWKALAAGVAIVVVLCLASLPLTGPGAWQAWLASLGPFQATTDLFRPMKGLSLARHAPVLVVGGVALAAAVLALLASGRRSLARFGVASIVASPTLYLHGLAPMLPGALSMRPDVLWLVLGLSFGLAPPWATWLSVAIVAVALLSRTTERLQVRPDLSAAERDLHPLGAVGAVWPGGRADVEPPAEPPVEARQEIEWPATPDWLRGRPPVSGPGRHGRRRRDPDRHGWV